MRQSTVDSINFNHIHNQLINQIKQAKSFLTQKVETDAVYQELIDTLDSHLNRLTSPRKPLVKIVSPSLVLAESLKVKNEANQKLRSLYEFQVISPISHIHEILQHCDLICLLYDATHQIRQHHHKLIELAQQQDISLVLLVHQAKSPSTVKQDLDADWLTPQQDLLTDWVQLPLKNFLTLDNQQQLDRYQRSLINLSSSTKASLCSRIELEINQRIKLFFNREITDTWQEIKQIREEYLAGEHLFFYQQQLRQTIAQHNQFRQQIIREIKQGINHTKADLLNPFFADNLVFSVRQIIDTALPKTVTEKEETYLYLILDHPSEQPYIHNYVLDFYQQKAAEILTQQWIEINRVYGSGGLEALSERMAQDLESISTLLDAESDFIPPEIIPKPSINLETFIDPYCLKLSSRIIFDYNYLQSSWFRLLISIFVGLIIYLTTWLLLGEGRYIGFIIIIFQVINLIVGQDIKKVKLKQHTKELKRMIDQRYQGLVRIIINQITQILTIAVDTQCQLYQEQWQEAIAVAQNKLDDLKQTSDQHKSRVERLEKDRDKLWSLFD